MVFDIGKSHRNFNERCRWWTRNESDRYEDNELVYKRVPTGIFYAKEVSAERNDDNIIAGAIMIDRTTVTIHTPDNVEGIQSEDLVEYQGELWRVEDVQKKKSRIQHSEFASIKNVSHDWYLTLIK